MIFIFLAIFISYLLGSIPSGFLIGKARGIDIRRHGSGNIGATNVFRVLGKKLGIFVFICDLLKGLVAVRASEWIANHHLLPAHWSASLVGVCGAIACILGHTFPVWLRFKGGKGVAASLGVVLGLMPLAGAVIFSVWLILFFTTRYVSIASIIASISLPLTVIFYPASPGKTALLIFAIVSAALVVLRHRTNIQRLLNGTENRFVKKK